MKATHPPKDSFLMNNKFFFKFFFGHTGHNYFMKANPKVQFTTSQVILISVHECIDQAYDCGGKLARSFSRKLVGCSTVLRFTGVAYTVRLASTGSTVDIPDCLLSVIIRENEATPRPNLYLCAYFLLKKTLPTLHILRSLIS
jgi:hypothetical protein